MGKIKILNRFSCSAIYEHECENNTIRKTIEEAINGGANLEYANLKGAYLKGANLKGVINIEDIFKLTKSN